MGMSEWLLSYRKVSTIFILFNAVISTEGGRFGTVKSDSTHHFFGKACTKSGSLRFSGCWLILSVYIIWVLTFPSEDCSEFGHFVITLIYYLLRWWYMFTIYILLDQRMKQVCFNMLVIKTEISNLVSTTCFCGITYTIGHAHCQNIGKPNKLKGFWCK